MSSTFEENLCASAAKMLVSYYAEGLFGFPFPDLPRQKKYTVLRPMTGEYEVMLAQEYESKVVAANQTQWLVDVELFLEWSDGEQEESAVHRVFAQFVDGKMYMEPLHRVPNIGWDASLLLLPVGIG